MSYELMLYEERRQAAIQTIAALTNGKAIDREETVKRLSTYLLTVDDVLEQLVSDLSNRYGQGYRAGYDAAIKVERGEPSPLDKEALRDYSKLNAMRKWPELY